MQSRQGITFEAAQSTEQDALLDGVSVTSLLDHPDHRGRFTEIFSDEWDLAVDPAQWSIVHSHAGVLRGMHHHRRHSELFLVIKGTAHVGLHDLRPGSPTFGEGRLVVLDDSDMRVLTFPAGIVHGWYLPDGGVHLQAVSETSRQFYGDDNLRCHWTDKDLNIPWQHRSAVLSHAAAHAQSLASLKRHLGIE